MPAGSKKSISIFKERKKYIYLIRPPLLLRQGLPESTREFLRASLHPQGRSCLTAIDNSPKPPRTRKSTKLQARPRGVFHLTGPTGRGCSCCDRISKIVSRLGLLARLQSRPWLSVPFQGSWVGVDTAACNGPNHDQQATPTQGPSPENREKLVGND